MNANQARVQMVSVMTICWDILASVIKAGRIHIAMLVSSYKTIAFLRASSCTWQVCTEYKMCFQILTNVIQIPAFMATVRMRLEDSNVLAILDGLAQLVQQVSVLNCC